MKPGKKQISKQVLNVRQRWYFATYHRFKNWSKSSMQLFVLRCSFYKPCWHTWMKEKIMLKLTIQPPAHHTSRRSTFSSTAFKLPDWSTELSCLLRDGCTKAEVHHWLEQGDKRYLKIKLINELISKELVTALM
jgi:hypothetical protein